VEAKAIQAHSERLQGRIELVFVADIAFASCVNRALRRESVTKLKNTKKGVTFFENDTL